MDSYLYWLLTQLPLSWQQALKGFRYSLQISGGRFLSHEPEIELLPNLVSEADWVLDVGANVGHYTKVFSELVGPCGRVISIEPVPATFSLLCANSLLFKHENITLINAAASNSEGLVRIAIPSSGDRKNFYQARITETPGTDLQVLAIRIDSLNLPGRVALVKVDAEGHEGFVILGMQNLLRRDRPVLILEGGARDGLELLNEIGYRIQQHPTSPNVVAYPYPHPTEI